jgi:hypothetical protein
MFNELGGLEIAGTPVILVWAHTIKVNSWVTRACHEIHTEELVATTAQQQAETPRLRNQKAMDEASG